MKAAVEGPTDEAALRRLALEIGVEIHAVYGKRGRPHLLSRLPSYNSAANHYPWFVLVDLDRDQCAPQLVRDRLPDPAPHMRLRVVERELESWLLADRDNIATYLSVSAARIPNSPDFLDDPKATLVEIASHSRQRSIREDMVPRPGSGRPVGPAYASRLIEFINQYWQPQTASERSPCLLKCLTRLTELAAV